MDWKILAAAVVGVAIGIGTLLYLNRSNNTPVDDSIPVKIGGTVQTEDGSKSLQVEFDLGRVFKAFQTKNAETDK